MFSLNDNLYNKARHSYINIYVDYSRPNGWTDFFVDTQGWPGVFKAEKLKLERKKNSTGNAGPFR